MTEAAGLVLGTIALAGLIRTCIETCEYIEDGRNLMDEVKLASTKVRILRIRLRSWASDLMNNKSNVSETATTSHFCWGNQESVVEEGLNQIARILDETLVLICRYRLKSTASVCAGSCSADHVCVSEDGYEGALRPSVFVERGKPHLRKRISWAVWDKKKFDSSIGHLEFLIQNLEKLSKQKHIPPLCSVYHQAEHQPSDLTDQMKQNRKKSPRKLEAKLEAMPEAMPEAKPEAMPEVKPESPRISQPALGTAGKGAAEAFSGHLYKDSSHKKGIVSQGTHGTPEGRPEMPGKTNGVTKGNQYLGTQTEDCFVHQGDLSSDALKVLLGVLPMGQFTFGHPPTQ